MSHPESRLYRQFVDDVQYATTVSEIRQALQGSRGPDLRQVLATMDAVEQELTRDRRPAAAELLAFVRRIATESLEVPGTVAVITNPKTLLAAVRAAPNALRSLTLLEHHRSLVTHELYALAQLELGFDPNPDSDLLRSMYCIAVVLNDVELRVQALGMWGSSRYRHSRNFRLAVRHLRRATALADAAKHVGAQRLALAAQVGFYRALRDLPRTIEIAERLLALATGDADRPVMISTLFALGSCYRDSGDPAKAIDTINRLLDLIDHVPTPPGTRSSALLTRGLAHEDLGGNDKGLADFQMAANEAEQEGDRNGQFSALTSAAASLVKCQRFREAQLAFQRLLRTAEGWGNPVMRASTHNNLGAALMSMERYADARDEFSKSLALRFGTGHVASEAISLMGIGDCSLALDDPETAKVVYLLALTSGLDSMDVGTIALAEERLSRREVRSPGGIDEAIETVRRIRDVAAGQSMVVHEGLLTLRLVECYLETGDRARAMTECEQLLLREGREPDAFEIFPVQIQYCKLLATTPEGWRSAVDRLLMLLERTRVRLAETVVDARRGEIVAASIQIYETLMALLTAASPSARLADQKPLEEFAFDLHESAKSRSFIAALADMPIVAPNSVPEDLRELEANLLRQERAFQETEDVQSEEYRQKRLLEIKNNLSACWARMTEHAPGYTRFRSGEPYSFRELAAALARVNGVPPVLVSFFVDGEGTTCFIIRAESRAPVMLRLPIKEKQIVEAARQLRRTFNGDPTAFPPFPPIRRDMPFRRSLEFLDRLSEAFRDVLEELRHAPLVCIAPHGPLHLIPLHALKTADSTYLAEHTAVIYQPSLSACMQLVSWRPLPADQSATAFVVGVSAADDEHPEYFEGDDRLFDGHRWTVASAFGAHGASREHVLETLAGHSVIHLSCHGYFDDRNPLDSGLVVSNGESKAPRDVMTLPFHERRRYLLTARDLMRAGLSARLVTLSACSSGLQSARHAGDELEGFSRALLSAGTSAALLGLWNLDQQSAQTFFTAFYRHLRADGETRPTWRALHAAQREFLASADDVLRHPYHWAPYTMIGDWR